MKVYTYSWEELKKQDINYIYMIIPEPFPDFDFFQYKIKMENPREKIDIKKAILTMPIIVVLIIIAISIYFYYKKNIMIILLMKI